MLYHLFYVFFVVFGQLADNDVIGVRHDYISGFFCLFRNIRPVNELFLESRDYQKVFSDSRYYSFDECSFKHNLLIDKVSVYEIDWEILSMNYLTRNSLFRVVDGLF